MTAKVLKLRCARVKAFKYWNGETDETMTSGGDGGSGADGKSVGGNAQVKRMKRMQSLNERLQRAREVLTTNNDGEEEDG